MRLPCVVKCVFQAPYYYYYYHYYYKFRDDFHDQFPGHVLSKIFAMLKMNENVIKVKKPYSETIHQYYLIIHIMEGQKHVQGVI